MADLRNKSGENRIAILRMGLIIIIVSAVLILLFGVGFYFYSRTDMSIDMKDVEVTQMDGPVKGQEIAIITTNFGEMRVALFRDNAPLTVENFVNKANEGFYDNTYISYNERNIFCVGGTKEKDGSETDKETIKSEKDNNMWPLKGSLISISSKYNKSNSGNRIMFVNTIEMTDEIVTGLYQDTSGEDIRNKEGYEGMIKLADAFTEYGGIPNFVGEYTVFGQTYKGFDVLEKITGSETDEETKIPVNDIIIESIRISNFE